MDNNTTPERLRINVKVNKRPQDYNHGARVLELSLQVCNKIPGTKLAYGYFNEGKTGKRSTARIAFDGNNLGQHLLDIYRVYTFDERTPPLEVTYIALTREGKLTELDINAFKFAAALRRRDTTQLC